MVPVQGGGSKLPPPTKEKKVETRYIAVYRPMRKTSEDGRREKIDILLHVDLELDTKAENVNISMEGLEHVNVCLASFLTKGVSYAQEKYNEYKQSPKDIEPIEEPKADTRTKRESQRPSKREIEEMRAWGKAYQAKRESK